MESCPAQASQAADLPNRARVISAFHSRVAAGGQLMRIESLLARVGGPLQRAWRRRCQSLLIPFVLIAPLMT